MIYVLVLLTSALITIWTARSKPSKTVQFLVWIAFVTFFAILLSF